MTDISGQLRLRLEQLVDEYVTSGAKALEVIAALEKELAEMKAAYDRDPDQQTIRA
ncbi:hypothetical protein ACVJBD_001341 [Rhizobium mongolense]